jgi:hypothetical protein
VAVLIDTDLLVDLEEGWRLDCGTPDRLPARNCQPRAWQTVAFVGATA